MVVIVVVPGRWICGLNSIRFECEWGWARLGWAGLAGLAGLAGRARLSSSAIR